MGERSGSLWIPPHCHQLTSPPCCSAFCQELTGVRTWGPSLTRILKGRAWCNSLSSLTVSFWQPRSPAVSLNSEFRHQKDSQGTALKRRPEGGSGQKHILRALETASPSGLKVAFPYRRRAGTKVPHSLDISLELRSRVPHLIPNPCLLGI